MKKILVRFSSLEKSGKNKEWGCGVSHVVCRKLGATEYKQLQIQPKILSKMIRPLHPSASRLSPRHEIHAPADLWEFCGEGGD